MTGGGIGKTLLTIILLVLLATTIYAAVLPSSNTGKPVDSERSPQYDVEINTAENSTSTGPGSGYWYPPPLPISIVVKQPEYLIQQLFNTTTSGGLGPGNGIWFPPPPPIGNSLTKNPQYLVQFMYPKKTSPLAKLELSLSSNASRIYINQTIGLRINSEIKGLTNITVEKITVYLVDDYNDNLKTWKLVIKPGKKEYYNLRLGRIGNHTLYLYHPRRGLLGYAESNHLIISVEKYPLKIRITADKRLAGVNDTVKLTVRVVNTVINKPVKKLPLLLFIEHGKPTSKFQEPIKIVTGENGIAIYEFKPNTTGTYTVYAISKNNPYYKDTTSNRLVIYVVNNPMGGQPVARDQALIAFLIATYTLTIISIIAYLAVKTRNKEYTAE